MKEIILYILNKYLILFPEEKERQSKLEKYLSEFNNERIIDWNNFKGHIVASGLVYSKLEKKFLLLYHNDMKIYIYPGGHIDSNDINPLEAAIREVKEETGLVNIKGINLSQNKLIPIDIDTHIIRYNERLKLPEHYHFDFRYLFIVDKISDVKIDESESSDFKWVDIKDLSENTNFAEIINKINKLKCLEIE